MASSDQNLHITLDERKIIETGILNGSTRTILYCFHFLRRWMFQFFYRIRGIIHWQAQTYLYLRYISSMYFEAIFSFYVFLYHFVGNSLFRLIRLSPFSDIIKRHFALYLAKLHFYADCAVRFLWESSTTVSTPLVCGNMSTGCIDTVS